MIDITTTGQWCLYTSYYRPRVFTMDASQNLFLFVSTGKSEFWGLTWLKQFQKWTCFYFVIFDCVWYFTHIWAKANLENYNLKLQHLQSYYKTTVAWCVCRFPVPNTQQKGTNIKEVPDLSGTKGKAVAEMEAKTFTAEKRENMKESRNYVSNRATKENDHRDKAWCPFQRC